MAYALVVGVVVIIVYGCGRDWTIFRKVMRP